MGARWFRWSALCLVTFLLLLATTASHADLITSKAYLEDPSGELTFQEVQDLEFTPYTGVLTKGFTASVYWLRLVIDPSEQARRSEDLSGFPPVIPTQRTDSEDLVLRVRPPYTDQAQLFDPAYPTATKRLTGNTVNWHDSEFRSVNHGFVLPAGQVPRVVWLRVATTSTMIIGVDVLPYDQMMLLEKRQEIVNIIDVALTVFFIVWAGLVFAARPDRVVSAFLVVMGVSFFYASNYLGYYRIFAPEWLPARWVDMAHSVLVIALPAAYMLFNRQLLREYRPRRWAMLALLPAQYYFVVGWLLLFLGHVQIALFGNLVLALFGQGLVCLTVLFGIKPAGDNTEAAPSVSSRWLLAYSLTMAGLYATLMVPILGVVNALDTLLYRNIVQSAVPFVFMALLVQMRHRKLDRWQQRQVAVAEQVAATEKGRREESEQFLAMLTHEIRTPLTVMAFAAKTDLPEGQLGEHVKAGIVEIDELIERCVQADRADQTGLPMTLGAQTLEALLQPARTRFVEGRVDWHVVAPQDLKLDTDATLFDVVLNNLIDNAMKYGAVDSRITVTVRVQSEDTDKNIDKNIGKDNAKSLVISITNNVGPAGFPDASRLFQKYYRAPRAHIRTGSGLGLYVARSFANKLGGQLTYAPTTELVRFDLCLPL